MADLDIHAFLDDLEKNFSSIKPWEPGFYLRAVRKNAEIKAALKRLPDVQAGIESLCLDIDQGNWGMLSHAVPPELEGHQIKDVLMYAYAAKRISAAEFATAHMVLNLKEQHGLEVTPDYRDTVLNPDKKFKVPARKEGFEFADIFDEDTGELTDEAASYLSVMADNLFASKVPLPGAPDKAALIDEMISRYQELPGNMQMFALVKSSLPSCRKNPDARRMEQEMSRPELFWQRQIVDKQMPLNACNVAALAEEMRNDHFYLPSSGMATATLTLLTDEVVKPVPVLGRVSGRRLAEMHLEGFHPVTIRDERVRSNYLNPHGFMAGALDAAMHDEYVHCFAASAHTPEQRQICCQTLRDVVDRSHDSSDEHLNQVAESLIALLADLAAVQTQNMTTASFLQEACRRTYVNARASDRPVADIQAGNLKNLGFFKTVFAKLAELHPELIEQKELNLMNEQLSANEQAVRKKIQESD